jgi:hypothetical protein
MWQAAFAFGDAVLKRDHDAAVIALRDCLIAADKVDALLQSNPGVDDRGFELGEQIVAFSTLMPEATVDGWALYDQDVAAGLTDLIRGRYDGNEDGG